MEVDVDEEIYNELRARSRYFRQSGVIYNEFVELNSAFSGNLKTFYLKNGDNGITVLCLLLTRHKTKILNLIRELLSTYGALKFNIVVESTYIRPHSNEVQITTFKTTNRTIVHASPANEILFDMFQKLCKEEMEYEGKGSGWSLASVDGILLRFSRYRPLGGSSYIPLPKSFRTKHAIINPRNVNDNMCFQWAILAKHVNSSLITNKYLLLRNKYNFDDINFPTPTKDINIFEKLNPNVSVNVYGLDKDNFIFPLRVCDSEKTNHFDLLLLTDSNDNKHYCYIKNFSRLIRSQVTKFEHKAVFCKRCFKHYHGQKREQKLREHKKDCVANKPIRVSMPKNDDDDGFNDSPPLLSFKNFHYQFKLSIVVYADFECLLKRVNRQESKYTFVNEKHEPMSFCVHVVYDSLSLPECITMNVPNEPYLYRGVDAAPKFMEYLISLANLIGDLTDVNIPMKPLTVEEQNRFDNASHCELCHCEFTLINAAVRDHDHLTGQFRAVLCDCCNLKRQRQKVLPVYIHGSSKYDNHFIVKQLGCDQREINVIPNSKEKYVSFSKKTSSGVRLRFVDSFRFLNASLSSLANNLPKDLFKETKMFFSDEDFPLVSRKGVFPYEYVDSWEKLSQPVLPARECFYNSLTETFVSDDDYNHAINVWDTFNCTTLGDYSDLYLRTDVLLLADIFENFRNICIQNYKLDPSHYLTLPSLTFDAMLKFTNVELELLTCYDKYLFIERGIRGGITSCVKRYAKANNPLIDSYDDSQETSYLAYIDANNLYGFAMGMHMPKNNFKWLKKKQLQTFDVLTVPNDSPVGYILECDICYPPYLHREHNDLPFLPENKAPEGKKNVKLLTTLENKTRYICHYMNLKQALQNGLVLKKIRRVLSFNQSAWLKVYIDFNTEKRKCARNDFEKDFYKLLNNAMFGKTIENVRKRMNLELVSSEKRLNKLISKPNFRNRIIYGETLSSVECSKEHVIFNKPIYIGFTVLELSKYHMYEFHYNIVKKYYAEKVSILYLDTDSYFYQIFTPDIYDDFLNPKLNVHLDLSDYPSNHKCFSLTNKKSLGKFKDECGGVVIEEFIGLRPKLYTFKTVNDRFLEKEKGLKLRKAKGITMSVVKNHITFDDYKSCVFQHVAKRTENRVFRSKKHDVETITVNKLSLSHNDDKRIICDDGLNTLAYGHYKIVNPELSYLYE